MAGEADCPVGELGEPQEDRGAITRSQVAALRARVHLLERALAASPSGILVCDRSGCCHYASPAGAQILGLRPELGLPSEIVNSLRALHEDVFTSGQPAMVELAFPTAHGPRDCECSLRPALGPDGDVELVVATIVDVTERKRDEQALREAYEELGVRVRERTAELQKTIAALRAEQQLFTDMLDALPAYVVLLSPDYHVPFANRFFRERFGESHGRRCFEWLFGRDEPCEACDTYQVLETMAPHEWQWLGPDGREYAIFDYPFTDADGSTLILEVGTDISEGKKTEVEIRRLYAELEHRVTERTRELEDILRAVSHDLRNPLTAIHGQLQLLQRRLERDAPPATLRENVDLALAATRRMNTLISDLVDSARSESGQLRLDCRPIDLLATLQQLKHELGSVLSTERIRVEAVAGLPRVWADPDRLARILENLLSNALKYSTASTAVKVSFAQQGDEVVTSVTDSGCGIAPEDLPRLFQRYFRAQAGRPGHEGLGLGLYITRMLVEGHGGRIWAASQVGQGSTFSFSLPVADEG